MNKCPIAFTVLVAGILVGCVSRETLLSVQFKNPHQNKLSVYMPVQDVNTWTQLRVIDLNPDSVYTISVKVNKGAEVILKNGGSPISVYMAPGSRVALQYDAADKENPCRVSGKNAAGIEAYRKLSGTRNISFYYKTIRDYSKYPLDTVPVRMLANFQQLMKEEIAPFEQLYAEKKIDKGFLNYVRNEITYYYACALSLAIGQDYMNWVEDRIPMHEGYGELWTKLYDMYPLTKEALPASQFTVYAGSYIEKYKSWKSWQEGKEATLKIDYMVTYNNAMTMIREPKVLEYVLGDYILFRALNNKEMNENILPFMDRYTLQFPKSPYNPGLKESKETVEKFHRKMEPGFNERIKFIEDYAGINSFPELLDKFKGKDVFIDFWFSTCNPCKEQFQYGEELKKFLAENDIEMLYVSVDSDGLDANWKNYIKSFDLTGYHIRANNELGSTFPNLGVMYYPHYMLVNKEGKIVVPKAKFPEERKALYEQIKTALNK